MISLNQLDTHDSVVTLCGLVKEAKQLRSLCTFFTGVVIQWPGGTSTLPDQSENGTVISEV